MLTTPTTPASLPRICIEHSAPVQLAFSYSRNNEHYSGEYIFSPNTVRATIPNVGIISRVDRNGQQSIEFQSFAGFQGQLSVNNQPFPVPSHTTSRALISVDPSLQRSGLASQTFTIAQGQNPNFTYRFRENNEQVSGSFGHAAQYERMAMFGVANSVMTTNTNGSRTVTFFYDSSRNLELFVNGHALATPPPVPPPLSSPRSPLTGLALPPAAQSSVQQNPVSVGPSQITVPAIISSSNIIPPPSAAAIPVPPSPALQGTTTVSPTVPALSQNNTTAVNPVATSILPQSQLYQRGARLLAGLHATRIDTPGVAEQNQMSVLNIPRSTISIYFRFSTTENRWETALVNSPSINPTQLNWESSIPAPISLNGSITEATRNQAHARAVANVFLGMASMQDLSPRGLGMAYLDQMSIVGLKSEGGTNYSIPRAGNDEIWFRYLDGNWKFSTEGSLSASDTRWQMPRRSHFNLASPPSDRDMVLHQVNLILEVLYACRFA